MKFTSKEDAIAFADKQGMINNNACMDLWVHKMENKRPMDLTEKKYNSLLGWEFTVQEPNQKIIKKKVYADNFKYSPKKLRFVKTK